MKCGSKHTFFLWIILVVFILGDVKVRAQLSESFTGIQGSAKYGFLIPHRSTMEHLVQGHTSFGEVGVSFQMDGSRDWHYDFNLPSVSFVLNFMDFGNREVLGQGFGTQIATYLPYFRKNGWSFGSRLGAGLGITTKVFDQKQNVKNNAIGSHLNALVTFGFKLEKQFTRSSLGLEMNMTHFSNGAFKLPNLGLNIPILGLQYTYYFEDIKYSEKGRGVINESEDLSNQFDFFSQLIMSTKQIYPTGGSNYGIVSLTNFTQYSRGGNSKLEAGLDLIYNQSIVREVSGGYGSEKNFQAGVYLAYILHVHNVDFLLGMGRYIHNPLAPHGDWYHKLGTRIHLTEKLSANIVIKSHWAKADYFEYGIAYRW